VRKNITLSAEESLIEKARQKAQSENTTLNQAFRDWLEKYAERKEKCYSSLMQRLSYAKSNRRFSREEMNER
jgi:hypothetical protein